MSMQMFGRLAVPLLLSGLLINADTLMLRNGGRVDGSYLGGDNRSVRFAVYDRVNTYNLSDIASIQFTGGGPASGAPPTSTYQEQNYPRSGTSAQPETTYAPPPPANGPYNTSSQYNPGAAVNQQNTAQPYNANAIQVPAGTELTVRLIDPVDSENDRLGQTYRASLDQPLVVNGQTVVPRGADAIATLIDSQKSGKIQGRTSLTLDLKNVTVNGKQYDITTTGVSEESSSRGARSAKVIGGTAAVGAIIGAIAGGGRGAAIGAGSGAAAGTAAQVITSGQKVKVPAETRLSFTLQNPLYL